MARFLLGVLTKRPTWAIRTEATADGLGFTFVWIVLNPDKLARWS